MSYIIQPVTNSKVNAALDTDYTVDSSFTISLVFGGTVNLGTGATTTLTYRRIGRMVDGWIDVVVGTSPTLGSGPWYIAAAELPYTPALPASGGGEPGGFGGVIWASEGLLELGAPVIANIGGSSGVMVFFSPPGDGGAGNIVGVGTPVPIGEGSRILGRFEYRAASANTW